MTKVIRIELEARQQQMNTNNNQEAKQILNAYTIAFSFIGFFGVLAMVLS